MQTIKVKMTPDDKATIKAVADEMRLSLSAYIRLAALRMANGQAAQ